MDNGIPIAILANENINEAITINPVEYNDREVVIDNAGIVIAELAIDVGEDTGILITDAVVVEDYNNEYVSIKTLYDYFFHMFIGKSQRNKLENVINHIVRDNTVLNMIEKEELFILIRYRESILEKFGCIILIFLIFLFINPLSLMYIPDIITNLYALININPLVFKINLVMNFLTITLLVLINTIITIYLYYILHLFLTYNVSIFITVSYLSALYMYSILIILIYGYIIGSFSKLHHMYMRLNQEQIVIMNYYFM